MNYALLTTVLFPSIFCSRNLSYQRVFSDFIVRYDLRKIVLWVLKYQLCFLNQGPCGWGILCY